MKPPRVPLYDFPDVLIHAEETSVKQHERYAAAKAGDIIAATALVAALGTGLVERVRELLDGRAVELVSVHALESSGVNEIPAALAKVLVHRKRLVSAVLTG